MTLGFTRADFPPGFSFAVATAASQIEGTASGGCGPSHWDSFAATPGTVTDGTDLSRACDHISHWEQDLDLIAGAGFDSYRFSVNWARVLPEGRGAVNAEGLAFYDRLLDGMLARGLKPNLTLYHWDLPSPLADLGGWQNRDTTAAFADYASLISRKLGDRVHMAAPVNEPWCVSFLSHFLGHHAPGLRDIRATARAMHHIGLAHGLGVQALRAEGVSNIGCVNNMEYVIPADDSPETAAACARYDAHYNRWFFSSMTGGPYPAEALDALAPHMPGGWEADLATIAQKLDWIGVNYYTAKRIAAAPGHWPALREMPPQGPLTDMGWEQYPQGLTDYLLRVQRDYARGLPIFVTENGMASRDRLVAGGCDDDARIAYFRAHLEAVRSAIAQGANVQGYTAWSLLDNFEWGFGLSKRFGLVHVDYESLQRTPKASYHAFAEALRTRR